MTTLAIRLTFELQVYAKICKVTMDRATQPKTRIVGELTNRPRPAPLRMGAVGHAADGELRRGRKINELPSTLRQEFAWRHHAGAGNLFRPRRPSVRRCRRTTNREILVKTTLMTFNDANLTGNYSVLFDKSSKAFRSQISAENCPEAFKVFRARKHQSGEHRRGRNRPPGKDPQHRWRWRPST